MKLGHYLTSYIKFNSKWIKNLNVRLETIKLWKKTYCVSYLTLVLAINFFFLYLTPKNKATKAKNQQVKLQQAKKLGKNRKSNHQQIKGNL